MTVMYGIKNCDTIKKARKFLEDNHIDYQFHDYRQQGISVELLHRFAEQLDWSLLLNTRGTTWRTIAEEKKQNLNQELAFALMLEQPALIKRPILEHQGQFLCGFQLESYQQLLLKPE